MMNPKKVGSPHLDTPSSRYNFCRLATKSMKNKLKKSNFHLGATARCKRSIHPQWLTAGPHRSTRPHVLVDRQKAHRREGAGCSVTPTCSPIHSASTGALGWLRGLPELARRWPWQAAALRYGGLIISDDGKPRRALLWL